MRRLSCAILLFISLSPAVTPSLASGQTSGDDAPAEEATSEYDEAVRSALAELSAGHLAEARAHFQRAHALSPSARTLRGLGLVEYELGHYVRAVALFEEALTSEVRPLTPRLREQVRELVENARGFIGAYRIRLVPRDAQLRIDGEARPLLPGEVVELDAGDHTLMIEREGYVTQRRRIDVNGGERAELSLALAPVPMSPSVVAAGEPVEENPWLWTGIGVGVATIVGVVLGVALYDPGTQGPFDDVTDLRGTSMTLLGGAR